MIKNHLYFFYILNNDYNMITEAEARLKNKKILKKIIGDIRDIPINNLQNIFLYTSVDK